jgi:hypothetical protein
MKLGGMRVELTLCMGLSAEIKWSKHTTLAETKGWPQKINFIDVPDRVMMMQDDFKIFFSNATVRQANSLYKLIVRNLRRAGISKEKRATLLFKAGSAESLTSI